MAECDLGVRRFSGAAVSLGRDLLKLCALPQVVLRMRGKPMHNYMLLCMLGVLRCAVLCPVLLLQAAKLLLLLLLPHPCMLCIAQIYFGCPAVPGLANLELLVLLLPLLPAAVMQRSTAAHKHCLLSLSAASLLGQLILGSTLVWRCGAGRPRMKRQRACCWDDAQRAQQQQPRQQPLLQPACCCLGPAAAAAAAAAAYQACSHCALHCGPSAQLNLGGPHGCPVVAAAPQCDQGQLALMLQQVPAGQCHTPIGRYQP
eukprot:384578-Pelagomonas_calceolata.AAC.3